MGTWARLEGDIVQEVILADEGHIANLRRDGSIWVESTNDTGLDAAVGLMWDVERGGFRREQPGPAYVFDEMTWNWAPETLAQWRDRVSVSRRDFCIAAFRAGLLKEADAVLAAEGGWPDSFSDALQGLEPAQIVEAKIEWASVTHIRRNAPLLKAVGLAHGVQEEAIDSLFGAPPA